MAFIAGEHLQTVCNLPFAILLPQLTDPILAGDPMIPNKAYTFAEPLNGNVGVSCREALMSKLQILN